MPLSTGQIISKRYRIVKLLGQGGFGAVYRAWDLNLKHPFALKENLDLSPESVRQFEREARFLAELHHPNLPRVIDCFLIPEQGQYLVMDFIEGETLEEKLDHSGGALTEDQVIPWINQVCDALSFLHSQNPPVIHRDVKPANIKITSEGKAALVDFGIAKAYFGQMQTTLGARAVTEGYSPPEQYGYGITDNRSDIYALGATLYHALTGHRPIESVQRSLGSDLLPPKSLNSKISRRVEASIIKAMAVDANRRFQSVQDFIQALESPINIQPPAVVEISPYQNERSPAFEDKIFSTAPRIPPAEVLQKPAKKSTKGMMYKIGIALIVVLCLMTAGLGSLWAYFGYLSETTTPSPTLTIPVEKLSTTDIPTLVPTDEPVQTSIESSPTWTPTSTRTYTPQPPTPQPPTPTNTPTEVLTNWNPCPGTYFSRLHVGDKAYVSYDPPWRNNVRSNPSLSATLVGGLEPGEEMEIMDGPVCADHMVWWKIRALNNILTGWTSEGDNDNYWLVPLP